MDSISWSRRPRTFGVVVVSLVVILVGVVALTMSSGASRPHSSNGFTTTTLSSPATPYPSKNLPPSRDNDAGRARAIDTTPDNDTDAWQRG